jgi:hypothetical protein
MNNNNIKTRSDSPHSDAVLQPNALQIAISKQDQQLLATLPRPPSGLTLHTPTRPIASPAPSPRPSDFVFKDAGVSPNLQFSAGSTHSVDAAFVPAPSLAPALNLGELQLVLDEPLKLYTPGDTITGYVSGCSTLEPLTHTHIILSGTAKSYIHTDATQHQDCAILLYQDTHPHLSIQGLVPRFSITIPESCAADIPDLNPFAPAGEQHWRTTWLASESYEHQPGHPLPPSMSLRSRTSHSLPCRTAARCYIEYKLIAVRSTLNLFTGKLVPEASFQVPIQLTTRRLPASTIQDLARQTANASRSLHIKTTQLRKERRLSLCERAKDTVKASLPGFYFSTTLTTPRVSIPGADMTIGVSVTVLPPPAGTLYNFPVPDICLKRLDIRIRSYQGLRVLTPGKHTPTKSRTFKSLELRTAKESPDIIFRPKNGNFDNQSCIITVALPAGILPSFKTYNLWRGYRLEVDVTLCVAGKERMARTESDLSIVSRPVGSTESSIDGREVRMEEEDMAASLEIAEEMVRRAII